GGVAARSPLRRRRLPVRARVRRSRRLRPAAATPAACRWNRLRDPGRRALSLGQLPELSRRDRRMVRLGARDLVPAGTRVRPLDSREPRTARARTSALVRGALRGLPARAAGARAGDLVAAN